MTSRTLAGFTMLVLIAAGAQAWGGLFNRINPNLVSDHGGSYAAQLFQAAQKALHDDAGVIVEGKCRGDRCTANEQCCDDYVCVETDEQQLNMPYGTCLPIFGRWEGEACLSDADCHSDFACSTDTSTCQPAHGSRTLGESCRASSDCDSSKGLCCQLQRRARSQPKKICSYYTDSRTCLGVVRGEGLVGFEHTAGEKRMSGHPDLIHFHNYYN